MARVTCLRPFLLLFLLFPLTLYERFFDERFFVSVGAAGGTEAAVFVQKLWLHNSVIRALATRGDRSDSRG